MNISPDGTTVTFKTAPKELFLAEKSGAKPNLLCLMDFDEWHLLKKHNPTKIIIQYQQELFIRTLTNIHLEGEMLNTWIVTFSWTHDQLDKKDETPAEMCQAVEEPSIDERFAAITVSNGTLALLQSIAHGRTMNMVIKELYEEYMCTRAKERGSRHD